MTGLADFLSSPCWERSSCSTSHSNTGGGLKKQDVMDFDETYNDKNEDDVEFVRVVLILEPFVDF